MVSEIIVQLKGVSKYYDDTPALTDVDLYIRKNEFVTLLGPSGCGKTTMLRLIGGFEKPDTGTITFNGQDIGNVPSHKRKVNTVFQRYALFSHLNVFENIAFGLRIKKMKESVIREKVSRMLELVNLQGYEKRDVNSLSGGQQQRVAIARALVNEPDVLLLDEPLAALDLKLRKEMQHELKNMQRQLGITFLFVTHDQEEALSMSDTVVVMKDGEIQQIGTPEMIYNEPVNAFVADFIGESNIVDGIMRQDYLVEFAGNLFECADSGFARDELVDVVIRPEDLALMPPDQAKLKGVVRSVNFLGVHYEMIVEGADGTEWLVHSTLMEPVGTMVGLGLEPMDIHIMKKVRA
ncbi:MAG: ABC transporter ATP-binding protein [Limnochordia bacterium]|nr:ABC transporter ATP-binding protein [Limnochordia bacterium]MDI9464166.1 ABC transporter ATP-binding protein [Bacillota bacterium]HOB41044.1 ABC transporter ATP-binding protein [Limnochordia bacterium]HOQ74229.1 ABC transporter ATP-binding protein [Limnochordia bacterium]HPU65821.1 ABC transporter ATP-binding protein [Limnochordia bacterium]